MTTRLFVLRLFLIYFFLQAVPLDWKWYQQLFAIDWGHLSYGAIFDLAHYEPRWGSGPATYADWILLLGISAIGAGIWTFRVGRGAAAAGGTGKGGSVEDRLYYWVRVLVRYRLAVAMIAYGFIKLFPLQAPYPSLSNLNTNYGDFTRWKLFSLSLGVVPGYESFLGGVEIVGALLLLYRRTASVGAFILAIFLGNVFMSNLAYGGGDDIYSGYLISLALFVLSYDAERLANLLFFRRPASPNRYHPLLTAKGQRLGRLGLKTAFIFFFVVLYGFKTHSGYESGPYGFPKNKGLAGVAGIYNVTQFVKGKDTLDYSRTDSIRWQDVVFESWATVSVHSNRPVALDSNNVERPELADAARTYELEGSAGRHYYSYETDTVRRVLTLRNKNPHYAGEELVLHYELPNPGRVVLSGIGADKDSLYVVLDRVDKKYLLEEARKKGRQRGLVL